MPIGGSSVSPGSDTNSGLPLLIDVGVIFVRPFFFDN